MFRNFETWIENYVPTPYSLGNSIRWARNILFGPDTSNPVLLQDIEHYHLIQPIDSDINIVFIGDIMPVGHKAISISKEVLEFISSADYLVGNLEGVVTEMRKSFFMDQRFNLQDLNFLKRFMDPSRIYLSVANNHAGDFGKAEFNASVEKIIFSGFNVFGTKQCPQINIEGIIITAATVLCNKHSGFQYINKLPVMSDALDEKLKILFLHWGFEHESYPRRQQVKLASVLLSYFDLLVGHHSHTPQPICFIDNQSKIPVAYSLGNFCFRIVNRLFSRGKALKISVGPHNGKWIISSLRWIPIKLIQVPRRKLTLVRDHIAY